MDVDACAPERLCGIQLAWRRCYAGMMIATAGLAAAATRAAEPPALAHTLAVCHPHLRRAPLPVPVIDVSRVGDPATLHMKLDLQIDAAGAVAWKSLTSANFGLPSEQQAVLAYAQALEFSVPSIPDCWGQQMEILADVFEQRNRIGQWTTLVRLYPRYALDGAGSVVTRD